MPRAAIYHNIGAEKLQRSYLERLWFNIGVSQLRRGDIESVARHRLLLREGAKWCATLLISLFYLVSLRPSKGWYLILMRRHISRGILSAL